MTLLSAINTTILLGHGNSLFGWGSAWNIPSPGNGLSVTSISAPSSGLPFFNVSYNFTSGVTSTEFLQLDPYYATALLDAPNATALSLYTFNPSPTVLQIIVTATDSAGKNHGTYPRLASGWSQWTLPFATSGLWTPVGVPWVLPLTQITIGPARAPPFATDVGWLGVADVALGISAPPENVHVPITFFLSQPAQDTGGILVAGQQVTPLQLGALLSNRLPTECNVTAAVQLRNSTGSFGEGNKGADGTQSECSKDALPIAAGEWQTCADVDGPLAPWETKLLACPISCACRVDH